MIPEYQENKFFHIKNFIPEYFADYLRNYFDLLRQNDQVPNKGDAQVENSLGIYGDPAFDTLLDMSTPFIENIVGKKLLPTYTYARIYFNDAELKPHRDREECEHSVSIFLGGEFEKLWPLWMGCQNQPPEAVVMYPGDAVVYRGSEIGHWREKFEGKTHFQIFLHYVEAEGEYKDRKFDTRPNLGLSSETKND